MDRRALAAFIRLGRPKFLFQSMLVVGLGVTLAVHDGHGPHLRWYVVTLLFGWTTHLMTHYCNEYFDLDADRANAAPTSWTGGSRVLVNGLLPPIVSLGAAFVLLFTGLALIAVMPTTTARLIAAATVALAWFYTAPPLRLNYRALGEVTCAAVLYGLGPILAAYLQSRRLPALVLGCVAVVFVFQFLRMAIMNLADVAGDRAVGKRTLTVVFGERAIIRGYAAGQLLGYAGILLLLTVGVLPVLVGAALLLTVPVPLWVARQLFAGALVDPAKASAVTFWSSMHMPLSAAATTVGLLADAALIDRPVPTGWLVICAATLAIFGWWLAGSIRGAGQARGSSAAPPQLSTVAGKVSAP